MPNRPSRRLQKKNITRLIETTGQRVASINAIRHVGDFCIMPRDEKLGIYELACKLPWHDKPSGIILKKVQDVIHTPQAADHVWNWDGNEERPTVNPMIESRDGARVWRGYLINGQLVAT